MDHRDVSERAQLLRGLLVIGVLLLIVWLVIKWADELGIAPASCAQKHRLGSEQLKICEERERHIYSGSAATSSNW